MIVSMDVVVSSVTFIRRDVSRRRVTVRPPTLPGPESHLESPDRVRLVSGSPFLYSIRTEVCANITKTVKDRRTTVLYLPSIASNRVV